MSARIPRMSNGLSAPAVTRARRDGGPRTDRNADRDGPRRTGVGTGWGRTATRSGTDRGRTGLGTGDGGPRRPPADRDGPEWGTGLGNRWGPSPLGPQRLSAFTLGERERRESVSVNAVNWDREPSSPHRFTLTLEPVVPVTVRAASPPYYRTRTVHV